MNYWPLTSGYQRSWDLRARTKDGTRDRNSLSAKIMACLRAQTSSSLPACRGRYQLLPRRCKPRECWLEAITRDYTCNYAGGSRLPAPRLHQPHDVSRANVAVRMPPQFLCRLMRKPAWRRHIGSSGCEALYQMKRRSTRQTAKWCLLSCGIKS
jgi:hypothetical protein